MSSESWDNVFRFIEFLVLPFIGYVLKKLSAIDKTILDVQMEVRELKTVLIGADGKNGIRSRLVRMERKVEAVRLQQASGRRLIHDDLSDGEDE